MELFLFAILVVANVGLALMQGTWSMAAVFAGAAIINIGLFTNALY